MEYLNYETGETPEKVETLIDPNKFEFGPSKRMVEESFDDYKLRRKREKYQMKMLNRNGYSRRNASQGTYQKFPLQP